MEEFQLLGQDLLAQDINPGRVAAPVLSYDAAESVLSDGERNGEEDNADPSVDEG
jgi:hypothetical protein